ncbi:unnamed protein product [Protopolystoma xenopodis]|uniref:Uncharacterized protein n=1 Tax=Protopolystoma xenopodis TaxID=117903 RepID=A0A3S4ZLZ1_9PLAT|nr:unnamed protein product [Protopolystoma xenopodis]
MPSSSSKTNAQSQTRASSSGDTLAFMYTCSPASLAANTIMEESGEQYGHSETDFLAPKPSERGGRSRFLGIVKGGLKKGRLGMIG